MQAYILVNTEPGKPWEVAEATLKIKGVKMAHAVTGQFDVVAYAEFTKIDDLGKLIEELQQVKGVRRTQTVIAMSPTIRK
jgi:DNA-binding Lrp family transcriptional regulator